MSKDQREIVPRLRVLRLNSSTVAPFAQPNPGFAQHPDDLLRRISLPAHIDLLKASIRPDPNRQHGPLSRTQVTELSEEQVSQVYWN